MFVLVALLLSIFSVSSGHDFKPMYKRYMIQLRDTVAGTVNPVASVLDINQTRALALGAPHNVYTPARLAVIKEEAMTFFEDRFGLTFEYTPEGYYLSTDFSWVLYPTFLGGPDYRLWLDSAKPQIEIDQDWMCYNIGYIGLAIASGNFTGGVEVGKFYSMGETAGTANSFISYGETLHVRYGKDWQDPRFIDIFAVFTDITGLFALNNMGFDDFHGNLHYISRTDGSSLYSWDDTYYENYIVPGIEFYREREVITQYDDPCTTELPNPIPGYTPFPANATDACGHVHHKRFEISIPRVLPAVLDPKKHPYAYKFERA